MKEYRCQVLAHISTPELSRKSQVSDFYNKLQQTDPNSRTRAEINHATASLLKNRQEVENYKFSEGYSMAVRTGGATAQVKRVLIGHTSSTMSPNKTPKRPTNFNTGHMMQKIQKLAVQNLSDKEIAVHPALNGLKLSAAQVSVIRVGTPLVDHGSRTPGRREVNLVG